MLRGKSLTNKAWCSLFRGLAMLLGFCIGTSLARSTLDQLERNRLGERELVQQEAYLVALREDQAALRAQRAWLLTDAGIISEARRLNWLKPGERRIWLLPVGEEPATLDRG